MRPVPRSRHLTAFAIFVVVAGAYAAQAMVDDRLSPEQLQLAAAAVKRHDPSLMQYDLVYGRSRMWQVHPPMVAAILETVLVPTDYRDPTLAFRVLTGIVTLGYLCGMYSLLRRQCRSWSVSTLVAVLSSVVVDTVGRGFWGVGALSSITPEGLVLAVVPMIALSLLIHASRWRVLLVFAAAGALGNIHLQTAIGLVVVLMVAYLALQGLRVRSVAMVVICGACAALAAGPYVWYFIELRRAVAAANIDYALGITHAVPAGEVQDLFYTLSEMVEDLGKWALLLAIPVTVIALVLSRVERFRMRDMRFWIWWAIGSVVAAGLLYGAEVLVRSGSGDPPPPDFLRTAGLLMLPFYAMVAQTITNLFRILHVHRALVRTACAVLGVAWITPTDNVRVARHELLNLAAIMVPEEDKPAAIQRHRADAREHRELLNIAHWARGQTATGAVLVTRDRLELRTIGQRSLLATYRDLNCINHLAPSRIDQWNRLWYTQNSLLNPTDLPRLIGMLQRVRQRKDFDGADEWYIITEAAATPKEPGALLPVDPPAERGPDAWGEFYNVYKVP